MRKIVLAAAIAGFYLFFMFYQGFALRETLFNVCLVGAFVSVYHWRARDAALTTLRL